MDESAGGQNWQPIGTRMLFHPFKGGEQAVLCAGSIAAYELDLARLCRCAVFRAVLTPGGNPQVPLRAPTLRVFAFCPRPRLSASSTSRAKLSMFSAVRAGMSSGGRHAFSCQRLTNTIGPRFKAAEGHGAFPAIPQQPDKNQAIAALSLLVLHGPDDHMRSQYRHSGSCPDRSHGNRCARVQFGMGHYVRRPIPKAPIA